MNPDDMRAREQCKTVTLAISRCAAANCDAVGLNAESPWIED
jgi:hypothetical protein